MASLKQLGAEILAAKYSSKYSSWTFPNPPEIQEREGTVDQAWARLADLSAEKKRVRRSEERDSQLVLIPVCTLLRFSMTISLARSSRIRSAS